jgi:hypothetical protein
MNNFIDEIWIDGNSQRQNYYKLELLLGGGRFPIKYIHERKFIELEKQVIELEAALSELWWNGKRSKVPISCGGTLEETTQDRLDKYSQAEFADKILEIRKLRQRVDELEAKLGGGTMEENELETERLRLAACGVAAMSNTKFTVLTRITDESPYYSASYGDVCRAVDREIRYREALERLANLGNGSMRGNSTGNIIAQEALDLDRPPVVQQDAVLTSGSVEIQCPIKETK